MISVIIPVFNVERYLTDCIESVLSQTISNIEIILVDDGSTDKSGEICDLYKKKDKRIKVIHKSNGGLSDARNVGVIESKGNVIAFIDSDDVVSKFFLEVLFREMMIQNTDMVCLSNSVWFHTGDSIKQRLLHENKTCNSFTVSPKEALKQMLYQKIPTGAPFHLCKRNLIEKNPFPKGFLYEDLATTYKHIISSSKISIVNMPLYGYRLRNDSIMKMSFNTNKLCITAITPHLFKDVINYDKKLKEAVSSRCFTALFNVFKQIPSEDIESQKQIWNEIRKYRKTIIFDFDIIGKKTTKLAALISLMGMKITHCLTATFYYRNVNK